jgi:hypothetical protein
MVGSAAFEICSRKVLAMVWEIFLFQVWKSSRDFFERVVAWIVWSVLGFVDCRLLPGSAASQGHPHLVTFSYHTTRKIVSLLRNMRGDTTLGTRRLGGDRFVTAAESPAIMKDCPLGSVSIPQSSRAVPFVLLATSKTHSWSSENVFLFHVKTFHFMCN